MPERCTTEAPCSNLKGLCHFVVDWCEVEDCISTSVQQIASGGGWVEGYVSPCIDRRKREEEREVNMV